MGNLLQYPVTSKILKYHSNNMFYATDISINGYRTSMEDSSIVYLGERWSYGGIFDGHSGEDCSNFVSIEIMNQLRKLELSGVDISNGLITDEQLYELCYNVDKAYYKNVNNKSGSTATFFILHSYDSKSCGVIICNIGDSKTFIISDNKIQLETVDHSPINPNEKDRITKADSFVAGGRVRGELAVSRAFGDFVYKDNVSTDMDSFFKSEVISKPDVYRTRLNPNSTLICACDGLFENDVWTPSQIASEYEDEVFGDFMNYVVNEAITRGSKDNISMLMLKFKSISDIDKNNTLIFIPGTYYEPLSDPFVKAYTLMANKAGLSLLDALKKRLILCKTKGGDLESEIKILENIIASM